MATAAIFLGCTFLNCDSLLWTI